MKTDEYVPSEDDMRHAYWLTRMLDHHADVDGAFDRFLARVRRDASREAEAERDAARGYISELETAVQSRNDVIKHRDARIKAVRALHTGTRWPGVTDEPICDACDQPWPCPTIRALDGHA